MNNKSIVGPPLLQYSFLSVFISLSCNLLIKRKCYVLLSHFKSNCSISFICMKEFIQDVYNIYFKIS